MPQLYVRQLGTVDYLPVWQAMQTYTDQRDSDTADQLWLLQHPPVFTLGQAGKPEHILDPGPIPIQQSDRGGQVTYHGPGQLVMYLLLDLRRQQLGVRELVTLIENWLIELLAEYDIPASARTDAPGVYTRSGAKLAQLGLRIRRGCSFHGLSLNIDVDKSAFLRINPCGYPGLAVANMSELVSQPLDTQQIGRQLVEKVQSHFGYTIAGFSSAGVDFSIPDQVTGEQLLSLLQPQ